MKVASGRIRGIELASAIFSLPSMQGLTLVADLRTPEGRTLLPEALTTILPKR